MLYLLLTIFVVVLMGSGADWFRTGWEEIKPPPFRRPDS